MIFRVRTFLGLASILLWHDSALACKCLPHEDFDAFVKNHVIFLGKALEQFERRICENHASNPDEIRAFGDVAVATRFRVEYSNTLPIGSTAVVFTNPHSTCGTYFHLPWEYVVAATEQAGLLFASWCSQPAGEKLERVRTLLGVPPTSLIGQPPPNWDYQPDGCVRPPNLDAAIASADAVGNAVASASCVVENTDIIEHSAIVTEGWKGLSRGSQILVRTKGTRGGRNFPYPFRESLTEVAAHRWPPAQFFRREGDVFMDDGCLTPPPPSSRAPEIHSPTRATPEGDVSARDRNECAPLVPLSCAQLDLGVLQRAGEKLLAWSLESKSGNTTKGQASEARQTRTNTTRRTGSCAGCSVSAHVNRGNASLFLLALLTIARRRRRCKPGCDDLPNSCFLSAQSMPMYAANSACSFFIQSSSVIVGSEDMHRRTQRRQYGEPVQRLSLSIRYRSRHTLRHETELVSIACSRLHIRYRRVHVLYQLPGLYRIQVGEHCRPI